MDKMHSMSRIMQNAFTTYYYASCTFALYDNFPDNTEKFIFMRICGYLLIKLLKFSLMKLTLNTQFGGTEVTECKRKVYLKIF